MIRVDAVTRLLIEEAVITDQEFLTNLKKVQAGYQGKRRRKG